MRDIVYPTVHWFVGLPVASSMVIELAQMRISDAAVVSQRQTKKDLETETRREIEEVRGRENKAK